MMSRWVRWLGVWGWVAAVGLACGGPVETEAPPGAQEQAQAPEPEVEASWATSSQGGATRWVRVIDGAGDERAIAVVRDADGNLVVLTEFSGSIDFGTGPILGPPDGTFSIALAKYRPDGGLLWFRVFTPVPPGPFISAFTNVRTVAVDKQRNIVLAGYLGNGSTIDYGGGPLSFERYVVKLDSEGRFLWARGFPGTGFLNATRVVTDGDGNIAVAGWYNGVVDFGQGPLDAEGSSGFLVKLSPRGESLWSTLDHELGTVDVGLAVDAHDNLYVSGTHVTIEEVGDPLLRKYSPRGTLRWTRRLVGAKGVAADVAVEDDRVVMTGSFFESFSFRGHRVSADRGDDAFVVAYEREGDERWVRHFAHRGLALGMDDCNGVVVTGTYETGDRIGSKRPEGRPGSKDNLFVVRLDSDDGDVRWVRGYASDFVRPVDLAVDRKGESTVLGDFHAPVDLGTGPLTPHGESDIFLLELKR